jgi:hypothetical protein
MGGRISGLNKALDPADAAPGGHGAPGLFDVAAALRAGGGNPFGNAPRTLIEATGGGLIIFVAVMGVSS